MPSFLGVVDDSMSRAKVAPAHIRSAPRLCAVYFSLCEKTNTPFADAGTPFHKMRRLSLEIGPNSRDALNTFRVCVGVWVRTLCVLESILHGK